MASLGLRPIHLQPLPYGSQDNLPRLGRGGPWVSRLLLESRAARCTAPTTFFATSKSGASRRPRPTAPHQPSPARQSQAQPWNRTSRHLLNQARRRTGTALVSIWGIPGPSGPDWTAESHSDFARRKFSTDLQVRVPRNGVRGKQPMGLGGAVAHRMRPRWRFAQSIVTPGEAQRSGFAGKRRNKGAGAVFAVRRKRRQADSR